MAPPLPPPGVPPRAGAAVAQEPRVDHLEPAAAHEDGPAPAALGPVAGGVAVGEGQVLHGELRGVLVLAVRGGPALGLVTGVLVEDPALPAAAEGHPAAAVEDQAGVGVAGFRGRLHGDGHRCGPAVEGDHAAGGDRADHRVRGAAFGGTGADHAAGVAGVGGLPVGRYGGVAVGVAGRRERRCRCAAGRRAGARARGRQRGGRRRAGARRGTGGPARRRCRRAAPGQGGAGDEPGEGQSDSTGDSHPDDSRTRLGARRCPADMGEQRPHTRVRFRSETRPAPGAGDRRCGRSARP